MKSLACTFLEEDAIFCELFGHVEGYCQFPRSVSAYSLIGI